MGTGLPSLGSGSGFSLGDAGNYALIAFDPANFQGTANSPINGNVGVGSYKAIQLASDTITGNLVTTGAAPSQTGGTITGSITGGSSTLAADIAALQLGSQIFAGEAGTSLGSLSNGQVINASSGTLDGGGNEVFNISQWADNLTISGSAAQHVVINVGSNSNFKLDNLALKGGITADDVLINYTGTQELHGVNGDTFNGTVLAPSAKVNVNGVTLNGHLFGGAAGQDFQWVSGANVNAPPPSVCPPPSPPPPPCPPPPVPGPGPGPCGGAPSLGNGCGFSLGDAANYALIAFNPKNFQGTADSPIYGNVGVGGYSGIQLANDTISGNLVTTGTPPSQTGGTVTGSISGNNSALATDIAYLQQGSQILAGEQGTNLGSLSNGQTIQACQGAKDCYGNEIFTVSKWADNLTINGCASDHVVINVGNNSNFKLDNLTLTGGITANNVAINYTGSQELHGVNGDTFNGTVLATNAKVNVDGVTLNGHLFGGAAGQDFQWVSNANVHTPPVTCCPPPPCT